MATHKLVKGTVVLRKEGQSNSKEHNTFFIEYCEQWHRFSDADFFVYYRLSKSTVWRIYQEVCKSISGAYKQSVLPGINRLLLTLRFYATGSLPVTLADFDDLKQVDAMRNIKSVSKVLAVLKHKYVKFPITEKEKRLMANRMLKKLGFPKCVGIIGCMDVLLEDTTGARQLQNEHTTSFLRVQVVLDDKARVINVEPTAEETFATNQSIFSDSQLRKMLLKPQSDQFYLIGDEKYPQAKCMMTPLTTPITAPEHAYQNKIRYAINVGRRQLGNLKRRFPILALGMRLDIHTACLIVIACTVLHNITLKINEEVPELPANLKWLVEADICGVPKEEVASELSEANVTLLDSFTTLNPLEKRTTDPGNMERSLLINTQFKTF